MYFYKRLFLLFRALSKIALMSGLLFAANMCSAQILASPAKTSSAFAEMLPEMITANTIDKVLALFTPPAAKSQLIKSDYLLLDSPPIARAGLMSVRMMSEIPGTEFFILFNSTPASDEPSFLVAQAIPNLTKADVRVKIKLSKSTELTMIVRAAGRWYSVTNDVKVVTK
jgi:hypothetical protein